VVVKPLPSKSLEENSEGELDGEETDPDELDLDESEDESIEVSLSKRMTDPQNMQPD